MFEQTIQVKILEQLTLKIEHIQIYVGVLSKSNEWGSVKEKNQLLFHPPYYTLVYSWSHCSKPYEWRNEIEQQSLHHSGCSAPKIWEIPSNYKMPVVLSHCPKGLVKLLQALEGHRYASKRMAGAKGPQMSFLEFLWECGAKEQERGNSLAQKAFYGTGDTWKHESFQVGPLILADTSVSFPILDWFSLLKAWGHWVY